MSAMTFTIYLLYDRETNCAYIGQTRKSVARRFAQHRSRASRGEPLAFYAWLRSLFDAGRDPSLVTLGVTDSLEKANVLERKWIAIGRFAFRCELMNSTVGGSRDYGEDFGAIMSVVQSRPSERAKRSVLTKAMWADPLKKSAIVAAQKAANATPSVRAKILMARKGMGKRTWAKPEVRASRLAGLTRSWTPERKAKARARWADPEYKARVSAAQRASFATPESKSKRSESSRCHAGSDSNRARVSAQMKLRWADPQQRSAVRAAIRKAANDPQSQAKRSAAMRSMWTRPEYVEKISAIRSKVTFREAASAQMKARWADPATRAGMIAGLNRREVPHGA